MNRSLNENTDEAVTPERIPNALENALAQLKENPSLISSLFSALSGMPQPESSSGAAQPSDAPANAPTEDSPKAPSPPIAPSPELLQILPAFMALLGHGSEAKGEKGVACTAIPPKASDKRCALLSALRPYLNVRRQEAIDTFLRLGTLSAFMKKSGS